MSEARCLSAMKKAKSLTEPFSAVTLLFYDIRFPGDFLFCGLSFGALGVDGDDFVMAAVADVGFHIAGVGRFRTVEARFRA